MTHNEKEIAESVEMLLQNPDQAIVMNFEEGDYVVLTKGMFDKIVESLSVNEEALVKED